MKYWEPPKVENLYKPYYTVEVYDNWHGHRLFFGRGREVVGFENRIKLSNETEAINLAKKLAKRNWPCGCDKVEVCKTSPDGWCRTVSSTIFSADLNAAYAA